MKPLSSSSKDTGRYPTEQEGLMALIKKPADVTGWRPGGYLQTTDLPKDNWGNDFVYKCDQFVIISYGADGKPGGAGDDADLHSTDRY
jgi:general secretion pathway protein G